MRKTVLVAFTLLIASMLLFTAACNPKVTIELSVDAENIVIARGDTMNFTLTVNSKIPEAAYSYKVKDNLSRISIISTEYNQINSSEYDVEVKGLKLGNHVLVITVEVYDGNKILHKETCEVSVTVINAAHKVVGIQADSEVLKLGGEYEFTPLTYPEDKTTGLEMKSSDENILRSIGDGASARFKVVGVGECSLYVTGKTVARYTQTFKTVSGDEGIGAFLDTEFPGCSDYITAEMLSQITSVDFDESDGVKDLTALNGMSALQSVSLTSLPIERLDIAGLDKLTSLNITGCDKLKNITLTDTGAVDVKISGVNPIESFAVSGAASLSLNVGEIGEAPCSITAIDIGDVGNLTIGGDTVARLESARFESVGAFGNPSFDFENIEEIGFINCADGFDLNFAAVEGEFKLYVENTVPASIDTLSSCRDLRAIGTVLNTDESELIKFFANASAIELEESEIIFTNTASGCKELTIDNNSLTTLRLRDVKRINALKIVAPELTEFSVEAMGSLRKLAVSGDREGDVYRVSGCETLDTLSLENVPQTDIASLPLLSWLRIEMSDIKTLDLRSCPSIAALICNSNPLLEKLDCKYLLHLEYLEAVSLTALTSIDIRGASLIKVVMAPSNPKLSEIITGDERLDSIEKVQVNDCAFCDIVFVNDMPNLKVLDIANNDVSNIEAIGYLGALAELYLNGNEIFADSYGLKNLNALAYVGKGLLRLSVGMNSKSYAPQGNVKIKLLDVFRSATKLEWLQAYNLNFTLSDFTENVNKHIKYLDVRGNQSMTSAQLKYAFPDLEKLVYIASDMSPGYQGDDTSAAGAHVTVSVDKTAQKIIRD